MEINSTKCQLQNNVGDTDEFHRPFYLLLNVAVGGNWPGFSINDSAFPQEMKVDYVRVYQDNPSYNSSSSNNVDKSNGSNAGSSGNTGNTGNSGNNGSSSNTPASGMGMNYAGDSSATAYVNNSKVDRHSLFSKWWWTAERKNDSVRR